MSVESGSKKVLITGCSSGFGFMTAVEAAKKGYNVIATLRNPSKKEYLEKTLQKTRVSATVDILDITNLQQIEHIAEKYKPVDILINNAGILIAGSFLDISDEEMHRVFETNYFGLVHLTRSICKDMIPQRSGLIINVASLAGLVGHMFNATYSASKHALVGFSKSIKLELKPFGINVVSIEPGYHKTEIIRANANFSDNFYDKSSPMFEYNRGFLRLMRDEIVPRAGEPDKVVSTIMKIMASKNPNPHYVIGKDAKLAIWARRLGAGKILENYVIKKLATAVRRENKRAAARKKNRKTKSRK